MVLRIAFAPTLAAGLIYHTTLNIQDGLKIEKITREKAQERYRALPDYRQYSFVKIYFCNRENFSKDGWKLSDCRVRVSRDMLYLISEVLVLIELGFRFRVGEIGQQKE